MLSIKDIGLKRILFMVVGVVVVFVGLIPLNLYFWGVLSLEAPHLRPAPGFALADSLLASVGKVSSELTTRAGPVEELAGAHAGLGKTGFGAVPADSTRIPAPGSGGLSVEAREGASVTESAGRLGAEEISAQTSGDVGLSPAAGSASARVAAEGDSATSGPSELEPLLPFNESKLARLVAVYQKMRPKQVALIMMTMPDRQAVLILSNMKDREAAQILAEIEPARAARLSELLVYGIPE